MRKTTVRITLSCTRIGCPNRAQAECRLPPEGKVPEVLVRVPEGWCGREDLGTGTVPINQPFWCSSRCRGRAREGWREGLVPVPTGDREDAERVIRLGSRTRMVLEAEGRTLILEGEVDRIEDVPIGGGAYGPEPGLPERRVVIRSRMGQGERFTITLEARDDRIDSLWA